MVTPEQMRRYVTHTAELLGLRLSAEEVRDVVDHLVLLARSADTVGETDAEPALRFDP